jgi:hypothetical protein
MQSKNIKKRAQILPSLIPTKQQMIGKDWSERIKVTVNQ